MHRDEQEEEIEDAMNFLKCCYTNIHGSSVFLVRQFVIAFFASPSIT